MKKITFPRMGCYTSCFKFMAEQLGFEAVLPPKITQETIKLGVRHSSDMVCLKGDTKITIDDYTSKSIKDIKVEDKVLTHKGRFRKVTKSMSRDYNERILKIDCGALTKLEITPGHPVLMLKKEKVKQRNFIPEFIEANKAEKHDFLAIPTPREETNISKLIWDRKYKHIKHKNEEVAYSQLFLRILGYWLAEGSILYNRRENKTPTGLSFVFSSKEKDYVNEICRFIKKNFNCSISTRSRKSTVTEILVYSKSLADIFLHLCNEKCDRKVINKEIMGLSPKLQLQLIKGFFRGDGHFNLQKKDQRYTSATVSEKLANQLFWILIRNHIKPTFSKHKQKNKKCVYSLRLWKGDISIIEGVDIKQIRKTYQHCIKTPDYIFVPIKKITEEKFNGKVYNLEVEEDNSYVASFLTVHNCWPFKVTLGNLIQGLEAGAEAILVTGCPENKKEERCRFLYYYHIQEQILRRLGYDFDIYYIRGPGWNVVKSFKKINPSMSYLKLIKMMYRIYKNVLEVEKENFTFEKKDINFGLVGEAYTLWTPAVNYDIINRLKKMGVGVDMSITLSWFLKHNVHLADTKKYLEKEAKKYFPKRIGGHGWESLYNTIHYAKNGFDGVIHLTPLSCMPESICEMPLNMISEDYDIPVYSFPIDENISEINLINRLEAFIEMIRWKGR